MQTQIDFITDLAHQYYFLAEYSDELFDRLHEIPENTLKKIYDEYSSNNESFQPVNLLRTEIVRQLINGAEVTEYTVDELKEKIRSKQIDFFAHLPVSYLNQFKNYPIGKRDLFASWQKNWNIFHTFFYRDEVKKIVQLYLNQICEQMLVDLDLPDYKFKWFDFRGVQHFGATRCWLALTPKLATTHKDAYQFFLSLEENLKAGVAVGTNLDGVVSNDINTVASYADTLEFLHSCRDKITALNEELIRQHAAEKSNPQNRRYFKFAPGEKASKWERFRDAGIAALGYDNLPLRDISNFSSREEINLAVGLPRDNVSNETWNLWLFLTAKKGDVIFASKGVNVCVGVGVVEGEYYYDETATDFPHRRSVRWITDKIYQYESRSAGIKVLFRFDTFSPTKVWRFILSEYVQLYPELKEVFDRENLIYDALQTDAEIEIREMDLRGEEDAEDFELYDFATDADKPFIAKADFYQAARILRRKKNLILQGSPGVGKTFTARKLAYQIIGKRADAQIEFVQFHQSFAYEDFVQGLRLTGDGTEIRNGVFYNFCLNARRHADKDFFFIIDEINRGNLSKIFGELMMLVEADKRAEKYALRLTYADDGEKFFVPPNVHLIGTMNTADRSLAIVDYALRRRFAFVTLEPQFDENFREFLHSKNVSANLVRHICERVGEINRKISADQNLGAGFQIGHSYFCGEAGFIENENSWFGEILEFEIRPLLEEIWFDAPEQTRAAIERLKF